MTSDVPPSVTDALDPIHSMGSLTLHVSGLVKVGPLRDRYLVDIGEGGVTFPGVSCTELQRTHLNIFNSVFLHRRDFRMKPGATETDFWESAILDIQLSNHPCTMVPTVQA